MTISFKDFALQFLRVKLPETADAAASASGFTHRPISMRAVIGTAAPYVPDGHTHPFIDDTGNSDPGPTVYFYWMDEANYPSSITGSGSWSGPLPNQRRQAGSWNLTVWEAGGEPGGPVINANVPYSNESAGLVSYKYVSIQLDGVYKCQVTAYNNYGSATLVKDPVAITEPGMTPTITSVTYLGTNNFQIKGSGFTPGGQVKLIAQVGGYAIEETITSDPTHGNISTELACEQPCTQANGGGLSFSATDLATGQTSNQPSANCH